MKLLNIIDTPLNKITMYRQLVYVLSLLIVASIVLSLLGILPQSALGIITNLIVLLISCYIANRALATLWNTTSNSESWLISAMILCCILPPSKTVHSLALVGLAGLLAMASKYIIAIHHKHIFNPAAFAALILGLTSLLPAIWWIGSPSLLPLIALCGFLILRKLRRFQLFFSFLITSLLVAILVGLAHQETIYYIVATVLKSSPLVFLGTVMLTEPGTAPPRRWQLSIYGLMVGALFTSQLRVGTISATPELALIISNVFAYIVSPKYKLQLRLKEIIQLSPHIYDFSFSSNHRLDFKPGQYLEWTLGGITLDKRGNRRTFSIASGPDDQELHITTKFANPSSGFKSKLRNMQPGDPIIAGQLAGNFVLPGDTHEKLVFIAGGIGITPFVSMAKDIIQKKQHRDICLFYFISDPDEYCYQATWNEAADYGLQIVPILSTDKLTPAWHGKTGRLTSEMLSSELHDYASRRYYLSGPNALVNNYAKLLRQLGIGRNKIVTDYFTGY